MRGLASLLTLPMMALVVLACGGESASEEVANRQEIQTTLEAYLPLLAKAYSTGELTGLDPSSCRAKTSYQTQQVGHTWDLHLAQSPARMVGAPEGQLKRIATSPRAAAAEPKAKDEWRLLGLCHCGRWQPWSLANPFPQCDKADADRHS